MTTTRCLRYRTDSNGYQRGLDHVSGIPCPECGGTDPKCDADRAYQVKLFSIALPVTPVEAAPVQPKAETNWGALAESLQQVHDEDAAKWVRRARNIRARIPGRDKATDREAYEAGLYVGECRDCKGTDSHCVALRAHRAALVDPDAYEAATGRPAASALHPDAALADRVTDAGPLGSVMGGILGADIGGRVDSTAMARVVVTSSHLMVAKTTELPLRSGLDDLGYDQWSADTITAEARAFRAKLGDGGHLWVVLDETGPGRTIAATVKRQLTCTPGVRVILCSITSGDEPKYTGDVWTVPKKLLMDDLAVAMQRPAADQGARLVIGPGGDRDKLARQVASIEAKELPSGHLRIESRGHDDLALAVALAVHAGDRAAGRTGALVAHNPVTAARRTGTGRMDLPYGGRAAQVQRLAADDGNDEAWAAPTGTTTADKLRQNLG